jgi:hypothetical protein
MYTGNDFFDLQTGKFFIVGATAIFDERNFSWIRNDYLLHDLGLMLKSI